MCVVKKCLGKQDSTFIDHSESANNTAISVGELFTEGNVVLDILYLHATLKCDTVRNGRQVLPFSGLKRGHRDEGAGWYLSDYTSLFSVIHHALGTSSFVQPV